MPEQRDVAGCDNYVGDLCSGASQLGLGDRDDFRRTPPQHPGAFPRTFDGAGCE